MKRRLCGSWRSAITALLLAYAAAAAASGADDCIVAARDAFLAGDKNRLARQIDCARGRELEPYVEYWTLELRLDEMPAGEVAEFLRHHQGSLLAERLRADWLKQLGMSLRWDEFEREYPALVYADAEIACYALQSRLARHDTTALSEAKGMWADPNLPLSCTPVLEALAGQGVSIDEVWRRLHRLLETKHLPAARLTATFLPGEQRPDGKTLERVIDAPAPYLHKLKPNFSATRTGRELAMAALAQMARNDPETTAQSFESIQSKFSAQERAYVYGQLAWQAALKHLPQALAWFEAAGDTPMCHQQLAWKARAGLRALDWRLVLEAVENMPPQLSTQPDWIYWRARALAALGRGGEAQLLYRAIAGRPNFYGNLADEELGRPIELPPKAAPPTTVELAAAEESPGIRRALALFRLDLRSDAVREWNWALRGQKDRFLLAAAELAKRRQIFDRAISAADRTQDEHDYDLRYLAPFLDRVAPKTRELALDQGWVYGLMRQESRFVTDAKSSAGAHGLMQLMPRTAKWVARKLGLKRFSIARMNDMDTNVALGMNYLKLVLASLDHDPVLASAAYNAGPGRARRWRDVKPLEGAIYAETIPLSETRDYVKKVMSNAVYYSALFDGKPQSLKARLGVIRPRGAGSAQSEDLP